ncbi:uncharacterized protein At4g14100-like [Rutidosis leptorrhynchoides]|uniref:uncharacterized protein At4g14100-like n=1 Tax=Rutidosis leptorrhynchoides TaxID=125765 RepID=UPI003A991CCB
MKVAISVLVFFLFQLPYHIAGNNDIKPWLNPLEPAPTPKPWPEIFRAALMMNLTSTHLQHTGLFYNWPKGYKVSLNSHQLGDLVYQAEWNNGTTFFYKLSDLQCAVIDSGVGIPPPDHLKNAHYLGKVVTNGFTCNLWENEGFIRYYEDVVTKQPVRWDYHNGITSHVMEFVVGDVLEDSIVQAPAFCFKKPKALDENVVSAYDSLNIA